MEIVFFVVLLAASMGFFIKTLSTMIRAAARGAPDPRPRLDQIPRRILSVLIYFVGQKKVAEEGPNHMTSKHHLLIFWGFLIITLASVEMLVAGLWPGFTLHKVLAFVMPSWLPGPSSADVYNGLTWVIDLTNLVVLMMIAWAFFRRIVIKPSLIPMNLDASIILGAIASLMITHFLYHAPQIAMGGHTGGPISTVLADLIKGKYATNSDFDLLSMSAKWAHVVILLTFLNYLPYSKHIHLLGALPNIFLRNLSDRKMDLPKLDLEDENQWGVGKFEQFSWKSLVDTYACTECARCSNYCPAYATEKNLSPMQLIHDIRYEMIDRHAMYTELDELKEQQAAFGEVDKDHKPADLEHIEAELKALKKKLKKMPGMTGERIAEDTLWACTTCGACQEVCPVFIEHPMKIIQMRQQLVLEEGSMPGELATAFKNIERQSNPWGLPKGDRMDWAEGLDVKTLADYPDPEYILWVGCAGAFDRRIIKQTTAMVKILNAAQVDYAVLGHQEKCTGDPARRAGNEMLFQQQAEECVEALNGAGAKKVITSCPHCLHTLRHDFPQFGGNYEVVHHTQLIARLLDDGKIKAHHNGIGKIAYHDSCYLGRWNGEYDAPRRALEHLPIPGLTELKRNKRHGFCCGAGGGKMFMEEHAPRINTNRTEEIIEADVNMVAVACPFCNIMLTDGMKEKNMEEQIKVMDVAELVANSIDVPANSLVRHRGKSTKDDADDAAGTTEGS